MNIVVHVFNINVVCAVKTRHGKYCKEVQCVSLMQIIIIYWTKLCAKKKLSMKDRLIYIIILKIIHDELTKYKETKSSKVLLSGTIIFLVTYIELLLFIFFVYDRIPPCMLFLCCSLFIVLKYPCIIISINLLVQNK